MITILIILAIILICIMSSKKNRKRNSRLREGRKECIYTYMKECKLTCANKTLSQIIDDYCDIFKENKNFYHNIFTPEELKSVIHL